MSLRRTVWSRIAPILLALGCATGAKPASSSAPEATRLPRVATTPTATATAATNCVEELPAEPEKSAFVLRFDALGYALTSSRWAVLLGEGQAAPHYRLYDTHTHCFVGEGTAGPRVLDAMSRADSKLTGDRVDLTMLNHAGEYLLVLDDGARFGPIRIADVPFASALPRVLRFLRLQHCGPTRAEAALHGACHLASSLSDDSKLTFSGDGVAVADGYQGPVSEQTGPHVLAEGGFHDAGDYIKFTGTTSFLLALTAISARDHQAALKRVYGEQSYAELRAELRWGLDWLIKMLGSGTLYHQVSGPRDHYGDFRGPEGDTARAVPGYEQRPVFRFGKGRGANVLGRAAAALAAGAEVFADDAAYKNALLTLAKHVYAEGKARPRVQNPVPHDYYPEDTFHDDLMLGAATLAHATGVSTYRDDALNEAKQLPDDPGTPLGWSRTDALALREAGNLFAADSNERKQLSEQAQKLAAPIASTQREPRGPGAAFHYALEEFGNGTIAESLGAAAACLSAAALQDRTGCDQLAHDQLHWLWGQNPFGLSFQIGVGEHYPKHPHHALAATAHVLLDGAIVGGPSHWALLDEALEHAPGKDDPYAKFSTAGLCYQDDQDNWVVNEPAIDFTAPLVFVLSELAERTP